MRKVESLIRLHRWQLDERRRRLGELLRLQDELTAQARGLEDELAREQRAAGGFDAGRLVYAAYAAQVMARRETLARSIAELGTAVEAAQEAVAAAYRDVKKFELARDLAEQRRRAALDRVEQQRLDEIGLEMHRRRPAV